MAPHTCYPVCGDKDAAIHSSLSTRQIVATPTPRHAWYLRVLATLKLWRQRSRSRRQLAQLDQSLLADTGITAAERQIELGKPFWR